MRNLKWYTVGQIAKRTGLSKYRVRKLFDKGTLHGTTITGHRMVEEQELKMFAECVLHNTIDLTPYKRTKKNPDLENWDDSDTVFDPKAKGEPEPAEDQFEEIKDQEEFYHGVNRTKKILEKDKV